MNETLSQLFETLSTIDPTIGGGIIIGSISIAYYIYHNKKSKNNIISEEQSNEQESNTDVNHVTMATKEFSAEDPNQETTEITTFKDLSDFSKKPSIDEVQLGQKTIIPTLDNELNHSTDEESILSNNDMVNFIEKEIVKTENDSVNNFDIIENLSHGQKIHEPVFEESVSLDNNLEVEPPALLPSSNESDSSFIVSKEETDDLNSVNNFLLELEVQPEATTQINHEEDLSPKLDNIENSIEAENQTSHINDYDSDNNDESIKLLNFAIEADKFHDKENALRYLKQAISTEFNINEKIRLRIILKHYENTEKALIQIVESLPTIKQIESLASKKPQPIRYVKVDNIKFSETSKYDNSEINDPNIDNELEEGSTLDEKTTNNPIESKEDISTISAENSLAKNIDNSINQVLEIMPMLSDVTFDNVHTSNLNDKNNLDNLLEKIASDIEEHNNLVEKNYEQDQLMTDLVLQEFSGKNSTINTEDSKNKVEQEKFEDLNFKDISNVDDKPNNLLSPNSSNKVWVHLIIKNDGKQDFINKKFQLTEEWGTLEAHSSLNKHLNVWLKQTYGVSDYAVTMVIPVK